jgi:hypothetical protein
MSDVQPGETVAVESASEPAAPSGPSLSDPTETPSGESTAAGTTSEASPVAPLHLSPPVIAHGNLPSEPASETPSVSDSPATGTEHHSLPDPTPPTEGVDPSYDAAWQGHVNPAPTVLMEDGKPIKPWSISAPDLTEAASALIQKVDTEAATQLQKLQDHLNTHFAAHLTGGSAVDEAIQLLGRLEL